MLDAAAKGLPVCFDIKYDTEKVQWNAISPIDYVYYGQTMKIKFGRPASMALGKAEALRRSICPATKPLGEL